MTDKIHDAPSVAIDHKRIAEILALVDGDIAFLENLLGIFSQNVLSTLSDLMIAARAGNMDSRRKMAHRAKGMSAEIGAHSLFLRFKEIEHGAPLGEDDMATLMDATSKSIAALGKVIETLKDRLLADDDYMKLCSELQNAS